MEERKHHSRSAIVRQKIGACLPLRFRDILRYTTYTGLWCAKQRWLRMALVQSDTFGELRAQPGLQQMVTVNRARISLIETAQLCGLRCVSVLRTPLGNTRG